MRTLYVTDLDGTLMWDDKTISNVGSKSERYKKCRHKSWHTQNGESNNQAAK